MARSRHGRQRAGIYWKSGSNYRPVEYPCRDTATAALRPVPPGQTRAQLYCPHCTAKRCILNRGAPRRTRAPGPGRAMNNAGFRAACRRAGLSHQGRPLARTCWNCVNLRRLVGLGLESDVYVCYWRHADAPREVLIREARSRRTLIGRKPSTPVHGCGGVGFALRLAEIQDLRV
ncbi:MAG: hypothetical protein QHH80_12855 [Anaerolineae bacterium]|nr:hypothetical protein [Anaerolineae bacterium]